MRGSVRIVGGAWRGRRLEVLDAPGLRPSPDRLRETLFNWLQAHVPGSRCLDLFAGTGALGLEAASRGAAEVTLVERQAPVAAALAARLAELDGSARLTLVEGTAERFLETDSSSWDIVFLDPPFADALQSEMLELLATGHLADEALVHVELDSAAAAGFTPPGQYSTLRERRFGDTVARLLVFEPTTRIR